MDIHDNTDVFRFKTRHHPSFEWDGRGESFAAYTRRWSMYVLDEGLDDLRTEGYKRQDGNKVVLDDSKNGDEGTAAIRKKNLIWSAFVKTLNDEWFTLSAKHDASFDVAATLAEMKTAACCASLEVKMAGEFMALAQRQGEDFAAFYNRLEEKASLCNFDRRAKLLDLNGVASSLRTRIERSATEMMILLRMALGAQDEATRETILELIEDDKALDAIIRSAKAKQARVATTKTPVRQPIPPPHNKPSTSSTLNEAAAAGSRTVCRQPGCGVEFSGTWKRDHLMKGKCKASFTCRRCNQNHHQYLCKEVDPGYQNQNSLTTAHDASIQAISSTHESKGEKLYVKGHINGQERTLLSDTGANVTAVGMKTAKIFGIRYTMLSKPTTLRGFDNRESTAKIVAKGWINVTNARLQVVAVQGQPVLPRHRRVEWQITDADIEPILSNEDSIALGYIAPHPKDCCISSTDHAPQPGKAEGTLMKKRVMDAHPTVFDATIRIMKGEPYRIPLIKDAKLPPRVVRNIQCPYHRTEAAINEIETQLREGIIERWDTAHSQDDPPPTSTAGFFVAKKDPTQARLVEDYVRLNNITERHVFSIPSADQQIADLDPNWAYFAVLDCTKGFHQVELAPESQPLTAFTVCSPAAVAGTYFYKRLPMGLHGATDAHDYRVAKALSGTYDRLLHEDILLGAVTQEEMEGKLMTLALRCQEHAISLSPKKFQLGRRVIFGGYELSKGLYRRDPAMVQKLANHAAPANKTELKSFLGLASQMLTHNADAQSELSELFKHTGKRSTFAWNEVHQDLFIRIKAKLTSDSALTYFQCNKDTRITTDASDTGLSFHLEQRADEKGPWRTVQVGCRTLAKSEKNWSASAEREGLAVAWAVRKCHRFLSGTTRPFTIRTDSSTVATILNSPSMDNVHSDRLAKVKLELMQYRYVVSHIGKKHNLVADHLSRYAQPDDATEEDEIIPDDDEDREFVVASFDCLATEQVADTSTIRRKAQRLRDAAARDTQYQDLLRAIRQGSTNGAAWGDAAPYRAALKHSTAGAGCLTEHKGVALLNRRVVIPHGLRQEMLECLHADHSSPSTMESKAKSTIWWPSIKEDINATFHKCQSCIETQPSNPHQPQQYNERAWRPRQRLHVDIAQDMTNTKWLIIADDYSGDIHAHELAGSPNADDIIRCYARQFGDSELPEVIRSDGEPVLVCKAVKEFLGRLHVDPSPSSPGFPESNGRAEAAVKAAKAIINGVKQSFRGNEARGLIARGLIAHRNALRYRATSPADILYGCRANDGIPTYADITDARYNPVWLDNDSVLAKKALADHVKYAGAKILPGFQVGDRVCAQDGLHLPFSRHGVIAGTLPHDEYEVLDDRTGNTLRRNRRLLKPGLIATPFEAIGDGALQQTTSYPTRRNAGRPLQRYGN